MENGLLRIILKELNQLSPLGLLLTKLSISIIIAALGVIAGRLIGRIFGRAVKSLGIDRATEKFRIKIKPSQITELFVRYVLYIGGFIIALAQLGLATAVLNVLYIGFVLVVLLLLILGLKDFVPNLIAGLIIHSKDKIKVGEEIAVDGMRGKIINMDLTETTLKTKKGEIIMIPNHLLIKQRVVKFSKKI